MISEYILLQLVVVVSVIKVESKECTINALTNVCECPNGYKNINGACNAVCDLSCGKGTCIAPNQCKCFVGYTININMLRSQTVTTGSLCIPSCRNCRGQCVAPNICIVSTTAIPTTTAISTTPSTTPTTITTPATIAFKTTTSATPGKTAIPATTTTIVISATGYADDNSIPEVVKNITISNKQQPISTKYKSDNNNTIFMEVEDVYGIGGNISTTGLPVVTTDILVFKTDAMNQTWIIQHLMFSLIPLLILTTAIIFVFVWRRKPIIRFLRGRSYVVEDRPPGANRVQYSTKAKDNNDCNDA